MKIILHLLTFICLFTASYLQAQTISTIAGTGNYYYNGDNIPVLDANLEGPRSLVFDNKGNYYFSSANRIRKVNKDGIITTVAGNGSFGFAGDGGPATNAQFDLPSAIAIDKIGNIYVCDEVNRKIRVIDTSGIIRRFAGTGVSGFSGDGGPAVYAQVSGTLGIFTDTLGNVYIADAGNHRIRKVDAAGIITTIAGTGSTVYNGDGLPATATNLDLPIEITFDRYGNMYIGDARLRRIFKVFTDGTVATIAGGGTELGDGMATNASLTSPYDITFDEFDNLYYAESTRHRIRKVSPSGSITTVAGIRGVFGFSGDWGPATAAELSAPTSIVYDGKGNLYIADKNNNRIRKVSGVVSVAPVNTPNGSVSLFPNPNQGSCTMLVAHPTSVSCTISVTDLTGRLLHSIPATTNVPVDLQLALPSGVYIAHVHGNSINQQIKCYIY